MDTTMIYPFADYWWLYAGFIVLVLALLLLDLGVFHKDSHVVSFKEAATWTGVWIGLAIIFNIGLYYYTAWRVEGQPELMTALGLSSDAIAKQASLEFLTGFVVEKSLAVDNIFVFAVVFNYFAVPALYQHRVLFYGILGALFFRAIFIAMGAALMQYHIVIYIFGGLLVLTGLKLLFAPDKGMDPADNWAVKFLSKHLRLTKTYEGDKFWVKKNGVWYATPLFLALVFLETTDIIFAVDSVPAIFAVTKEPLIVFTSNIFAILGLRSMYFMLAGVMDRFIYIKYGLGLVLVFVGLKMAWLNDVFGGKFPISWSLGIIATLIGGSIAFSLLKTQDKAAHK